MPNPNDPYIPGLIRKAPPFELKPEFHQEDLTIYQNKIRTTPNIKATKPELK